MIFLLLFAFLGGIVTILSPCILPILPIVLSSSVVGGKRRPLGIVTGFIFSFTFFTLALSAVVRATGLPPDFLRYLAVVLVLLFGIGMLLPKTQQLLEQAFTKLTVFTPKLSKQSTGFISGIVLGLSLGLLWTPCVGPILATIITLAATSNVTTEGVAITLTYALGTAIPMLAILYGGKHLLERVRWLNSHLRRIQMAFGVLMIVAALAILFNLDRKFQTYIVQAFPQYGVGLTKIEQNAVVSRGLSSLQNQGSDTTLPTEDLGAAPDFTGGTNWLNSPPLSINDLKGKVILVDFWTYTCINCIRTLPYVTGWYNKYKDKGFVVVGVHSPEFEFEKNTTNVMGGIKEFKIQYPVVQDNNFKIWYTYHNTCGWPYEVFIDKNGQIRETYCGEGAYAAHEQLIQKLLTEAGSSVDQSLLNVPPTKVMARSPESYIGYSRIARAAIQEQVVPDKRQRYTPMTPLPKDYLSLAGEWTIGPQRAMPSKGAVLSFNFQAGKVFLVMRPKNGVGSARILLDGKPVPASVQGNDVKDSMMTVSQDKLYELLRFNNSENHILQIEFEDDNVEVYAFQFG